jgi:hypothetical protein
LKSLLVARADPTQNILVCQAAAPGMSGTSCIVAR